MQTRTLRTVVYLAAGLGLLVAFFAAAEFVDASLQKVCSFNGFFSCAAIASSGKTTFLGIPDYAWGIAGFIAILALNAVAERYPDDSRWTYALLGLTTAGVGLALYYLYVELGLVGALCLVCFSAYVMGFVAWAAAIELSRRAWIVNRPE